MKLKENNTEFTLLLNFKNYKTKTLLNYETGFLKVLKNYDNEYKQKSKIWKKCLLKLKVYHKKGYLVKIEK